MKFVMAQGLINDYVGSPILSPSTTEYDKHPVASSLNPLFSYMPIFPIATLWRDLV